MLTSSDKAGMCRTHDLFGPSYGIALWMAFLVTLAACGDSESPAPSPDDAGDGSQVPTTYAFEAVTGGGSSVSYGGQIMRQVLMEDLKATIGGLTMAIDDGSVEATGDNEVLATLEYYYEFDADSDGEAAFAYATDPAPVQTSWSDLGSKNLSGKLAGNDSATDHADWSTAFVGGAASPEATLYGWFDAMNFQAITQSQGEPRYGVDGHGEQGDPLPVHLSVEGLDYQQLVQKFLTMAISFSQGTDDYLDDDVAGKGLLASNVPEDGDTYTPLMHHWDEAFGYYGAARDNGDYEDAEIAGKCDACIRGTFHDTDGDGVIDLLSEVNFGHSQNAAKRDHGSASRTDLSGQIFQGFLAGRALISQAGGDLSETQATELGDIRDEIVSGWEMAVAATVIHYINGVLGDMEAFGADDYSFANHAKHWSEMKGFALGLQFNPRSPVSDGDFESLHSSLGAAPTLPGAPEDEVTQAKAGLVQARDILQASYSFDPTDVAQW